MRRTLRVAAGFAAVSSLLWVIGRLVARRIEGAVTDDDAVFSLAAIWGSREFASKADPLLAGSAQALLGGVELDLTGAVPAPKGARLLLSAVFGGIHVRVPGTWRVEVVGTIRSGDVHVDVTSTEALTAEAPTLLVDVSGRAGGISIEAAG